MTVNWFSPLPPARTDIAGFTARILPVLRERVELRLWTEQKEWTPHIQTFAPVHCYDSEQPPWPRLQAGDISIYNIGNNCDYHAGIWQVSRQMPGVIILHDQCLQHLLAQYYLYRCGERDTYIELMARFYGSAGRNAAISFTGGGCSTDSIAAHYPLTELAVEHCLGVIVHTRRAFDSVRLMTPVPVLYAPLPYSPADVSELQRRLALRRRAGRSIPFRLVMLGHMGANRRIEQVLEALAGHPGREQFRLDVYGSVWDRQHVRKHAAQLGIGHLFRLHGFVEDLDGALATADLALNLRYPTMGEASGTQLRLWDHSLPTLVTRTGWYASLPEDTVGFVRPEHEIDDIRTHLSAFLASPDKYRTMGNKGRSLLEREHTPSQYAAALAGFLPHALSYHRQMAAFDLAGRAGGEIAASFNHSGGELLVDRVSQQINDMFNRKISSRLP